MVLHATREARQKQATVNAESGNLLVAEMRDFAVAYRSDVAAGD
jgi:hypothetical protein